MSILMRSIDKCFTRSSRRFMALSILVLLGLFSPPRTMAQFDYFRFPVWHPSQDIIAVTNAVSIRLYTSDFSQLLDEYTLVEGDHDGLRIGHMAWSPDGTMLAVSLTGEGVPFNLQIWNLQSGQRITEINGVITDVPFTWGSNSDRLAVAHIQSLGDETIRIYEVSSGTLLQELQPAEPANVWQLAWRPDGNQMVTYLSGSNAGTYVVDLPSGAFTPTSTLIDPQILYQYSPSGLFIAGVLEWDDIAVQVWNITTFEIVTTLEGHTNWIRPFHENSYPKGVPVKSEQTTWAKSANVQGVVRVDAWQLGSNERRWDRFG